MAHNSKKKAVCIGAGLVALDVVLNGNPKTPSKIYAGGSCGNVITILSFLEWETYPVARLADNTATKELISDLERWNVNTNLVSRTHDGSTPIIIQRIKKDENGNAFHKFEFKNPNDGTWLPRYKPVLSNKISNIIEKLPCPEVFYFDRINRASIEMARYFKIKGALIFFEPSSIGEPRLFQECLEIANIIKFSNDRIKNYDVLFPKQRVPLEIETMGSKGLRFRFSHDLSEKKWNKIDSFKIGSVIDAAGAGDWCSAGIIYKIGKDGAKTFKSAGRVDIINALIYGQSLGSINCLFDGARGTMYNLDKNRFSAIIKDMIKYKTSPISFVGSKETFFDKKPVSITELLS